jgi:hypothetical protein
VNIAYRVTLRDRGAVVRSAVSRSRGWSGVKQLTVLVAVVSLTTCGSANDRLATGQANPCNQYTCDGLGAQLNIAHTYQLPTHCGVLEVPFDGRVFYVESLYPADVPAGLDQPVDAGTMVLLSAHLAEFQDPSGHHIRFVDSPPGEIGKAYPFTVHVLAGGNLLIDERFAGRVWHAQGTLPGISGPQYGNGHDAYAAVAGSLTLVSADRAVFVTSDATTVAFDRTSLGGCE